jgi:hypothetical protein
MQHVFSSLEIVTDTRYRFLPAVSFLKKKQQITNMNSFLLLVLVSSSVLLSLASANVGTPSAAATSKLLSAIRFHGSSKAHVLNAKPKASYLRTESHGANVSFSLLSTSNQYVEQYGFFEEAYYTKTLSANPSKCASPNYKYTFGLNVCVPWNDGSSYVNYVYADPAGNTYYVYEQDYTDSNCQVLDGDVYLLWSEYILICTDLPDPTFDDDFFYNDYSLFNAIPFPLNPVTDNLGVSYLQYNSQTNCQTNDYSVGVYESSYYKLNLCYGAGSTGNVDSSDVMFTGCNSSTGLSMNTFTSTDGTCSGTWTPSSIMHSDMCAQDAFFLYSMGWLNFGCVGVSS